MLNKNFISEYRKDLNNNLVRIQNTPMKLIRTELGMIEYIDIGEGIPVLLVHGINGGADQAQELAEQYLGKGFRIIGVNRFGYLNSPLPFNSSPAAQADLYAALLDELGIQKLAIAGTSAASPSVLQFAIRYAGRCSSVVLWSMAVPGNKVPSKPVSFGIQSFFQSNFLVWFIMKYFPKKMQSIMGVPEAVQNNMDETQKQWLTKLMWSLYPTSARINGIMNDVRISNPNLNRNYSLEKITCPTLVIHAFDDPMPPFETAKQIAANIPGSEFMPIASGGHLLIGFQDKVRKKISEFIKEHNRTNVNEEPILKEPERRNIKLSEPPTFFY